MGGEGQDYRRGRMGRSEKKKRKTSADRAAGEQGALCGRRIIGAMERGLLASPGKKLRFYSKGRVMGEFVKDYRRCGVRQMTLVIGIISRMRIRESRTPSSCCSRPLKMPAAAARIS